MHEVVVMSDVISRLATSLDVDSIIDLVRTLFQNFHFYFINLIRIIFQYFVLFLIL